MGAETDPRQHHYGFFPEIDGFDRPIEVNQSMLFEFLLRDYSGSILRQGVQKIRPGRSDGLDFNRAAAREDECQNADRADISDKPVLPRTSVRAQADSSQTVAQGEFLLHLRQSEMPPAHADGRGALAGGSKIAIRDFCRNAACWGRRGRAFNSSSCERKRFARGAD